MSAVLETSHERGWSSRRRAAVHLGLFIGFSASLVTLAYLTRHFFGMWGTTFHGLTGALVLGLVVAHLFQRRRTVRVLLLAAVGRSKGAPTRYRGWSDIVLFLLTLNVMVSGLGDYVVGHTIFLPIPGPYVLQKWHAMSALILLIYVVTHVVRRRRRLWRSRIA